MALPRKSTRNGTRGYAHLVEIDVPVARVWRALTEPGLIRIWSGQEAEIDARQGGMYRIGKRTGAREAHIDIFEVNRRLEAYLPEWQRLAPQRQRGGRRFHSGHAPGEGKPRCGCLGSGIPGERRMGSELYHASGWAGNGYLARIKATLESPPVPKKAGKGRSPKIRRSRA